MSNLKRNLSQILLSKIGGNVDHITETVLCELIDNSTDNKATSICIYKVIDDDKKPYLVIFDNGTGMENIDNIFLANEGKVNKKGCKNQGFLDSLAHLSNISGELDIFTNCNGVFSRIFVDFNDMKNEYEKQLKTNCIDYNKCQELLVNNYTKFNDRHTRDHLKSNIEILEKIKSGGTYIKIPLYKDFELENINPLYFQYSYNHEFKLNFLGQEVSININDDICISKNFKPVTCNMYRAVHINESEIYKFNNNVNTNNKYLKKVSQFKVILPEEYEKCLNTYRKEEKIASLKFSLISSEDADKQKEIFNENSIENMRQLWISYQGKTLGPFKFPKTIKGTNARNLLDLRIVLEINNDKLIKDIIMTNKSHTNLDCLDNSIIKFIEYCKNYFSITYETEIGKIFSQIKKDKKNTPGIPNMIKYLQNEESMKKEKEAKAKDDALAKEAKAKADALAAVAAKEKEKKELIRKQIANYQPWKFGVYFGILECNRIDGISGKDNYIRCHYGITNDDPNHRDSGSGLGTNWRRLFYTYVNDEGSTKSEGKYVIEWKLYQAIKLVQKDNGIKWETKEYFKCPIDKFNIIYKIIRKISEEYEGTW